jgi:V8-like Glu-specific endopeptidase
MPNKTKINPITMIVFGFFTLSTINSSDQGWFDILVVPSVVRRSNAPAGGFPQDGRVVPYVDV